MQEIIFDKKFPLIIFDYKIPFELKKLHLHNCMEVGLIINGEGEFYVEKKIFKFKKDDILLINRLEAHRAKSTGKEKSNTIFIYISDLLLEKATLFTTNINYFKLFSLGGFFFNNLFQDVEVKNLLKQICDEYISGNKYKNEIILTQIINLLILLYRKFEDIIFSKDINNSLNYFSSSLLQVLDHINNNYSRKILIKELADICNLSESYFRKIFKKIMGTSPKNFIIKRRLKNSYISITDKGSSAFQACYESGFENYSNFLKLFKKEFGILPKELKSI